MAKVFIVDDEQVILNVLKSLLNKEGHDAETFSLAQDAIDRLETDPPDLIISDLRMEPVDGLELLRQVQLKAPSLPVLMMTAFATVDIATEAMSIGVFDFLTKPFKIDVMLDAINRALAHRKSITSDAIPEPSDNPEFAVGNLIAVAPEMRKLVDMVKRIARTEARVLIKGAFGSGKKSVAQCLHDCSNRCNANFVSVNCANLPEPVIEAQLFPGVSNSSAKIESKLPTLFEQAMGGTLFFDEIDMLSIPLQEKINGLVKQKHFVHPKDGSTQEIRFLASTSRDLAQCVKEGTFVRALYRQFGTVELDLLPLRKRRDDILPIAMFIMRQHLAEGQKAPKLSADARALLFRYSWPGNVSELNTVIVGALAKVTDGELKHDMLPEFLTEGAERLSEPVAAPIGSERKALKDYLSRQIGRR